jgi:hypothetical protein
MNLKTQRNILGIAVVLLLVLLGVLLGTGALSGAAGAGSSVTFDSTTGQWVINQMDGQTVNPLNPGQSVVGQGTFIPGLFIHKSGGDDAGNDVVFVSTNTSVGVAYGGNTHNNDGTVTENVVNGCSIPGGGIADIGGPPYYGWTTKKHDYTFTFAPDTAVSKFQIGVLDWGDYLQWQGSQAPTAAGTHTIQMFGYDASGAVVAQYEYTFHTDAQSGGAGKPPTFLRPSTEFPNYTPSYTGNLEQWGIGLKKAGDACEAEVGQPGKLIMAITGTGIVRVQVKFKDQRSMDPLRCGLVLWISSMNAL